MTTKSIDECEFCGKAFRSYNRWMLNHDGTKWTGSYCLLSNLQDTAAAIIKIKMGVNYPIRWVHMCGDCYDKYKK